MRVKSTSSQERMRLLTSESLKSLEQFLGDEGSTKSFCDFLIVAGKISTTSKKPIEKDAYMASSLPEASTPPSTSKGVIFCSLTVAGALISSASGMVGVLGRAGSLRTDQYDFIRPSQKRNDLRPAGMSGVSHPLGLLDSFRHLIRELDLFPVIGTDTLLATIVLPGGRTTTFFRTEDPFWLWQLHLGEPFRKLFRHGFRTSLVSGLDDSLRLWTGDIPSVGSRIGKGRKGRVGVG